MPRRLWLALALLSCGAPPSDQPSILYSPCAPVHLVPGADTTEAERQSIVTAVELWRAAGVTALTLDAPKDAVEGTLPLQFRAAAAVFRGVYEPSSGLVSINRGLSGTERDVTVAHELGHALGLPHLPASTRRSVMNPSNLTILPAAEDAAELERLWGCPL